MNPADVKSPMVFVGASVVPTQSSEVPNQMLMTGFPVTEVGLVVNSISETRFPASMMALITNVQVLEPEVRVQDVESDPVPAPVPGS